MLVQHLKELIVKGSIFGFSKTNLKLPFSSPLRTFTLNIFSPGPNMTQQSSYFLREVKITVKIEKDDNNNKDAADLAHSFENPY